MRKYDEKITRRQWTKEPPETLMNILHKADISLAFKTYTIYRAGKVQHISSFTLHARYIEDPNLQILEYSREGHCVQ